MSKIQSQLVKSSTNIKMLVTGFEPFGGEKVNPSEKIVKKIARENFNGIELYSLLLPVSYQESIKRLDEFYNSNEIDITIHIGQAGGATAITIERLGVNIMDSTNPDNDNINKDDENIVERARDAYMTRIDVKRLVEWLNKKKIPTVLSYTAGQYICNEVYYYSLHHSEKYKNPKYVLFVHLPFLPEQVAEKAPKSKNIASMSLTLEYKAIKMIVTNVRNYLSK